MPVDLYASLPHYLRHAEAVWAALPDHLRGAVYVGRKAAHAAPAARVGQPRGGTDPIIVAGYADLPECQGRPVCLVEHGAGQTYAEGVGHRAHPGGHGREQVSLYLDPSERVANLNRAAYPHARAVAIGTPAYLDPLIVRPIEPNDPPVIGVTFHHEAGGTSRSGWQHYASGLRSMAREFPGQVIGHQHPQWQGTLSAAYERAGIPVQPDYLTFLASIDVLAADNTSALPEAGACGKALCWLDYPLMDRHGTSGGRFGEWPEGQAHATGPSDWAAALRLAVLGPQEAVEGRKAMLTDVYSQVGGSAQRAAQAVAEWAESGPPVIEKRSSPY